jgi:hypothetical protein
MTIRERIISVKRHTIGFVIDGAEFTKKQTIDAAKKGRITNARIVKNRLYGSHLVGQQGTKLYDLPTRFSFSRRFAAKRRA